MQTEVDPVRALRRFNRLYTRKLRLLEPSYLGSPFTLTQARVLHEIATRRVATAAEIAGDLGLDMGYLSRILSGFQRQGLVLRKTSPKDRRSKVLSLTAAGRRTYRDLNRDTERMTAGLLNTLAGAERQHLVQGLALVEQAFATEAAAEPAFTLRAPRAGDIAWTAYRQAVIYAEELGWDDGVEPLVLSLSAKFIEDFDPAQDACWIAERGGSIVGAVFLVRDSARVGRLRMLYVEPSARGLGVGSALVEACIARARELGYRRLTLWTNNVLGSARRIYEAAGFTLTREKPHKMFGKALVGQDWDLVL